MRSVANTMWDPVAFRAAEGDSRDELPVPAPGAASRARSNVPLLETRNLAKRYGGLEAVAGVDLVLSHPITGLIGPNGAGKTTLLNIVSGVERASAGEVRFRGRAIGALPPHRLAALGLVRTFQISRELNSLTVLENLLLARPHQAGESLFGLFARPGRVRREEAAAIETARAALQRVNLWRLADAPAGSLSGGQKKLLELARAVMLAPRLILLDEPAAGVAPAMEEILIDTIRGLAADGVGFLIIEHDLEIIAALCDHVCVMAAGQILTEGSFAEVTADARVVEAYLGLKP
ncbi:MAG: ABC transporter ATP-binding protein [Xanthobacteraceae bacterium]|nr:ABC transporter ATP-binding protein [Xanthobacteraceae bacterium]